ncbi:hypothetical protein LJC63_01500 [Ruminococcaceae bacterium OttesenSCG-928-L11]|nr:hypothetical protein [Ruminococcaceae bacterium OttesenSCG-928-L11]
MRISNFSMARNYRTNLTKNQYTMYKANEKVQTGRRFSTMSEDVSSGLRAFQVRRSLAKNETSIDNVRDVQTFYKSAEDSVNHIQQIGQEVAGLYTTALNGTSKEDELNAISKQVTRLQEEILTTLNGQFSDRYMFGGTQITSAPFATNADGYLTYKGVVVKDITDKDSDLYKELFDDPSYIDLGLGLELNGDKSELVPNTVFDRSLNGLDIIGYGPDNMYDVITDILNSMAGESPDPKHLDRINSAYKDTAVYLTKLGADVNYLDFTMDRLEADNLNLIARQDALEFIPREEAILDWQMQNYVYNAALSMGSKLLQPSLFSYLS